MFKVFVLAEDGSFVQHGPVRSSEAQATTVAKLLARRLGWVAVAAVAAPSAPSPLPPGLPSLRLAGLSPVWKDAGLAAQWAANTRSRGVRVAPPAPPVAEFNPEIEALGLGQ